ncbi:MAG: hypothetical protein AAF579_18995, partial [Cyanobacteria bacterium P01_C01_bin.118]
MSIPNETNERFHLKNRISPPVVFMVSGTLLVTCNGAALALNLTENSPAISSSSALLPTPALLTQATPVPEIAPAQPGVQFSPYSYKAIDLGSEQTEPTLDPDKVVARVSKTAVDLALTPASEELASPFATQILGVISSDPIEQFHPFADVPIQLAELIDQPTIAPAASPERSSPIERLKPFATVPVRLTELINSPVVNPLESGATTVGTAQDTTTLDPGLGTVVSPSAPIPTFQPSNNPIGVAQQMPAESAAPPIDNAASDDTQADTLNAQSLETVEPASVSESISYSAADLLEVPARFGVNASTATNGFGESIGVHGFVPLDQEINEALNELDITFLEGDLQMNDGDPSFSLNLGHRGYRQDNPDDAGYIRGGYVGVDGRFTDDSSFFQLASGYERINDDWEFRLNGYLPIGERTNTIQSVDFDTGLQVSNGFEGNQLVLSAIRERQRILQQEDALGGFDAEFGAELSEWDGGELMGYVGGYLLSGEESSIGGQARLAVNFESNFNAGLSLQHDGLFGTTVALSLSATWPEFRFQDEDQDDFEEEFEVPIRLRDPIARRDNVAINEINESEIIYEEQIEPLRNPE